MVSPGWVCRWTTVCGQDLGIIHEMTHEWSFRAPKHACATAIVQCLFSAVFAMRACAAAGEQLVFDFDAINGCLNVQAQEHCNVAPGPSLPASALTFAEIAAFSFAFVASPLPAAAPFATGSFNKTLEYVGKGSATSLPGGPAPAPAPTYMYQIYISTIFLTTVTETDVSPSMYHNAKRVTHSL